MENQIIERTKMTPDSYKLYNFLCEHCIGQFNAIKQEELSPLLNLDRRTIRKCIAELDTYPGNLKIVCTGNAGVWIATSKNDARKSADVDLKKGIAHLAKYQAKMRKLGLDGQYKIQFSTYEKPMIEAIVHDEPKVDNDPIIFEDENGRFKLPV